MTVNIPLTRGMHALIDDVDADMVRRFTWYPLHGGGGGNWYAYRRRAVNEHGPGAQLMHQLLTGWPRTDHSNGNGLDNRRVNLRAASREENGRNSRTHRGSTSQYKGVFWKTQRRRWVAQIYVSDRDPDDRLSRRRLHLGSFTDEVAAALAYDAAARTAFGEFAALNFPEPGERSALS